MKQVLVINDSSQPLGGASSLALKSARLYKELGLSVTFLTGQSPPEGFEELGIDVIALGKERLLDSPRHVAASRGFHNFKAQQALSNWIKEHDTPDTVYHMHNWAQVLSPAIFIPLRRVSERTIITCHDFFGLCPNGSFTHFNKSSVCELDPLSTKCLLSQCDRRNPIHKYWRVARQIHLNTISNLKNGAYTMAYIHRKVEERFLKAGFNQDRGIVIPNTVAAWSETRVPAENNKTFLFVGRVGADKGADIALAAADDANVPLTLAGNGELLESSMTRYPKAEFLGWTSPSDLSKLAQTARCLIVPSRVTEPFGLVILEAAMSGIPVLVSDRAFLATDIERLGMGYAFSINQPNDLANKISQLSQSDSIIKAMSEAGFQGASGLCMSDADWIKSYREALEGLLVHSHETELSAGHC